MKKYIVNKKQLNEYVERKKTNMVFDKILEDLYNNSKNLKEGISIINANQTIIENYERKKMLTPEIKNLLKKNNLI